MSTLKHVFSQPLRAAGVGQAGIENGFHQRELGSSIGETATRHHVAHHEDVRLQCELVDAEAFDQLDAERAKLIAHRRIDT